MMLWASTLVQWHNDWRGLRRPTHSVAVGYGNYNARATDSVDCIGVMPTAIVAAARLKRDVLWLAGIVL